MKEWRSDCALKMRAEKGFLRVEQFKPVSKNSYSDPEGESPESVMEVEDS